MRLRELMGLGAQLLSHLIPTARFPGGSAGKESACKEGDPGLISGLGRSPGEGNGSPLQYACLENPMDGGAWRATVHGVAKSRTRLSDFTFIFTFQLLSMFWIPSLLFIPWTITALV